MQIVYTDRVIHEDLLRLWSNTADKLQTIVIEGQDMETARVEIEEEWTRFILTRLLHVDSHPTLTRFFSFRAAVDRMLTLSLLQFPATGGLCTKPSAREVTQKRITRERKFFGKPASGQALRRASLVLQLTAGVEAFMSAIPKHGEIPTLVALQHGKAQS